MLLEEEMTEVRKGAQACNACVQIGLEVNVEISDCLRSQDFVIYICYSKMITSKVFTAREYASHVASGCFECYESSIPI